MYLNFVRCWNANIHDIKVPIPKTQEQLRAGIKSKINDLPGVFLLFSCLIQSRNKAIPSNKTKTSSHPVILKRIKPSQEKP